MTSPGSAIRVDPDTGVTEHVGFIGEPPTMFAVTHLPAEEPVAGVLICPTIHAELFRSYRKEVLLARRLAQAGVAVQRFNYRGTGNSDGNPEHVSLHTMAEDASQAAAVLVDRIGTVQLGYVGTRLGAFAALAATDTGGDPVLLWDPVVDGKSFLNEVFRSHYIGALKGRRAEPVADMVDRVQREGGVEVLGYRFGQALYDSLSTARLADHTPGGAVRVVAFGANTSMRVLVDAWSTAGIDISTADGKLTPWWLEGTETASEDADAETLALVDDAATWLLPRLTI